MKKLKFLGTIVLAASLLFAGCSSPVEEEIDPSVVEAPEKPKTPTTPTKPTTPTNPGSGYNAPDLSTYYKNYLVSSPKKDSNVKLADWGDGSKKTPNDDGSYTISASGSMWGGIGGICAPLVDFEEGTFAKYEYIVFTVDTTDYVIDSAENSGNYGVNIKIAKGEPIGDQIKLNSNYVANGNVRTYYAPISSFNNTVTPVATEMAIIIGGEGTIKLNEVYFAAAKDPSTVEVTGITASFNITEGFSNEAITLTVKDSNLVDRTSEASYSIVEGDTTGSTIDGNVLTAGATPGTVTVKAVWDNFETTAQFIVLESYLEKVLYDENTNELNFNAVQGWWGTFSVENKDSFIESSGAENGCGGIPLNKALSYKAGAKIEIKYIANNPFALKPVNPNVETMLPAAETEKTEVIELGGRDQLSTIGIVFKSNDSFAKITSIKLINEQIK